MVFATSVLPINSDGSIYHLGLLPEELATTVILVGDPDRVPMVSRHFDRIAVKKQKREFVTHTGTLKDQGVSVISTGIGTSNIDIVLNELDALANIDFKTREAKPNPSALTIVRLGTCGAVDETLAPDSLVISNYAIGADGGMRYYQHQLNADENRLLSQVQQQFASTQQGTDHFYVSQGDADLLQRFCHLGVSGITFTCPGFYAAQNRQLRIPIVQDDCFERLSLCSLNENKVLNLEMETSFIYALGKLFGHRCCSISCVVYNRRTEQGSKNSKAAVEQMIERSLAELFD